MTEARASDAVTRRGTTKLGVVTSNKMQKSVVVRVDRTVLHPKYKRYVKRSARYMAHDEADECRIGDTVQIRECRPISKDKKFYVEQILERAVVI